MMPTLLYMKCNLFPIKSTVVKVSYTVCKVALLHFLAQVMVWVLWPTCTPSIWAALSQDECSHSTGVCIDSCKAPVFQRWERVLHRPHCCSLGFLYHVIRLWGSSTQPYIPVLLRHTEVDKFSRHNLSVGNVGLKLC